MAKTQSVVLSGDHFNVAGNISINVAGIAMSPDGKKLATTDATRGIRLYESHDLTIQKYVHGTEHTPDEVVGPRPVAFDPTSRFYAVGRFDGRVDLGAIS
jgi:WD40 repeat protein